MTNAPKTPAGHEWIVAWLRRMMDKHDLSARAWAGKTGTRQDDGKIVGAVSPTTITRFLATGTHVPSLRVLAELAQAIGEKVPLAPGQLRGFVDVPLISPTLLRRGASVQEAMGMATGAISVPQRFSGCGAVVVSSESATLAGVMPGDTVVFDPVAQPQEGSLVAVVMEDGGAAVLRLQGGMLHRVAASLAPPLPVDSVVVLGVARHVQRDLG